MVQITNMHSLKKNMERKNAFSRGHFFATTNGKYQILGVKFAIDIQVYQARLFASLFWNFQCIFFPICAAEYIFSL